MTGSAIWLPAALVGGALQAWRTALQRRVSRTLSVNAAGLIRYLYGLPVAIMLLLGYQFLVAPAPVPSLGAWFLPLCLGGGFAQIVATNLLLMAFGERNFVVGTAYSKTEAVQSALLSAFLLGDRPSLATCGGIACGVVGVMVLSTGGKRMRAGEFFRALGQPAARYGIASGFAFALTTIGIRAATQQVRSPDHVRAALIVLVATVALQSVLQGAYLVLRERDQVARVFAEWRVAGQVGLLSSVASACWFTGFASAPVALVRIVGQVEIAFTMGFAHFYLGETTSRGEIVGLGLVAVGVVLALAGAL